MAAVTKRFGAWERGPVPARAECARSSAARDDDLSVRSARSAAELRLRRHARSRPRLARLRRARGPGADTRRVEREPARSESSRAPLVHVTGTPAAVTWRRGSTPSVIGGSAAVSTAKTDSALIEWLGELRGAVQRPPTEQEMALARGALTGALPAQIETDDLVANRVMSMLQNDVPLDFYNSYGTRIAAVTPASVSAAAGKYLDASHLVIVVAGDRKTIEPALRAANIAPVVIVDERGRP